MCLMSTRIHNFLFYTYRYSLPEKESNFVKEKVSAAEKVNKEEDPFLDWWMTNTFMKIIIYGFSVIWFIYLTILMVVFIDYSL